MSAFGDVVQALIGAAAEPAAELAGQPTEPPPAPVPSVGSRPGRIAGGRAWTAPDASGHGQLSVHRDVLRGVAAGMRSDLRDLDEAVGRLAGVRHGAGVSITGNAGLVAGWPTAVGFNGNASAAFTGVVRASQQTGTAHQAASSRLASSAATYDQSESDNLRAARSVGTNLDSVAGLVASYGSGGRPVASALGSQPSYPVKTRAVSGFSGAGMSAGTIMAILHGLSPAEVAAAGTAHTRLGTALDTVAGRLAANAKTLAQNWSGSAAQGAMGQFQLLHDRMVTLAQQALQVGSVLSWLGGEVLPQFTTLPDPRVSAASLVLGDAVTGTVLGGPVGGVIGAGTGLLGELDGQAQAAADRAAQQYIAKLSGYLVVADQSLPAAIGAAPAPAAGRGSAARPTVAVPAGISAGRAGSAVRLRSAGGDGSSGPPPGSGRGGKSSSSTASPASGPVSPASGPVSPASGPVSPASGPVSRAEPAGLSSRVTAPPSSLQGATVPGGQLPPPPGSTSTPAALSVPSAPSGAAPPAPSSVGGLSGGLAGPAASVPGAAAATEPPLEASGLVTGLTEDEPSGLSGLSGASGMSAADPAVAADVIGAQAPQLQAPQLEAPQLETPQLAAPQLAAPQLETGQPETGGAVAGTDEATVAPDMAGFPMLGSGGGRRTEQERIRQAWLSEDDLWNPPVDLVKPVIDD